MRFRLITLSVFFSLVSITWSQEAPTAQDYMRNAQDALKENDTTSAIGDYLLAIHIDSKNWQAYQNLGGCYIQLRKMEDAKAAYLQSLTINPNNPELKKFMTQVFGGFSPAPIVSGKTTSALTPTPVPIHHVDVVVPPYAEVVTPTVTQPGEAPPQHFKGFKPYVFQDLPRYNLPDVNSLTLDLGGAIWYGGVQNFDDYFGSSLSPGVSSHAGWEVDAGIDYAVVNDIQVGFHLEGLVSPVTRSQLNTETVEWDSYCVGGTLALKYLIPINSAMSLVAHVEGGYYTLVGSDITYNQGSQGNIGLGGSAFGGLAELQLELFQVLDKSLALDLGLGYRFLRFDNLTGSGSGVPNPFVNANGTPVYDDFSGPRISLSIRFVH